MGKWRELQRIPEARLSDGSLCAGDRCVCTSSVSSVFDSKGAKAAAENCPCAPPPAGFPQGLVAAVQPSNLP